MSSWVQKTGLLHPPFKCRELYKHYKCYKRYKQYNFITLEGGFKKLESRLRGILRGYCTKKLKLQELSFKRYKHFIVCNSENVICNLKKKCCNLKKQFYPNSKPLQFNRTLLTQSRPEKILETKKEVKKFHKLTLPRGYVYVGEEQSPSLTDVNL